MTYNIRGGLGMDSQRSTGRIAEVVAAVSPDIVCFQEVHQRLPQSGFVDQPRQLKQSLRLPLIFQANLHIGFGGYGIAIAAHFPVIEVKHHRLPSVREQRGALQLSYETAEGILTIFCTHWGLNNEERGRQAATLAREIKKVRGPLIVCGDLNARPGSPQLEMLLSQTGLGDADFEANRLTYPADRPEARIDYVLHSGEVVIESVFPLVTLASDHLPVIADFSIRAARE